MVIAVDDSFYKITSEALLVLHLIVKTIRSPGRRWYHVHHPHTSFTLLYTHARMHTLDITHTHTFPDVPSDFDFHPYVGDIYGAALKRLRAADIDQEVKERAITCM